MIKLYRGDCLDIMPTLPDKSVDLVLTDPPYGTTQSKWDSIIPLALMWGNINKIINTDGVVCIFGAEPFSSVLRTSNLKAFKYDWIINKSQATGHLNAYKRPMVKHEIISVFNGKKYYPQLKDKDPKNIRPHSKSYGNIYNPHYADQSLTRKIPKDKTLPVSIIEYKNTQNGFHPNEKSVDLLEYLVKTYTTEGETVLDFTMGSGSIGVACANLNRNFIGIEKEKQYFDIAVKRITEAGGRGIEVIESIKETQAHP